MTNGKTWDGNFKYLRGIAGSLYSAGFYRNVAKKWRGLGFFYLLLLVALCMVPPAIRFSLSLKNIEHARAGSYLGMAETLAKISSQLPDITIKDGTLHTDAQQPYTIYNESAKPMVIIDTTGNTTTLRESSARLLITKDYALAKFDEDNIERIMFNELLEMLLIPSKGEILLNNSTFPQMVSERSNYFSSVFFIFFMMSNFLFYLVLMVLLTGVGILLSAALKADLSFKAIVRLVITSSTFSIILFSVLFFLDKQIFANETLVLLALQFAYLFYAVESNIVKK